MLGKNAGSAVCERTQATEDAAKRRLKPSGGALGAGEG